MAMYRTSRLDNTSGSNPGSAVEPELPSAPGGLGRELGTMLELGDRWILINLLLRGESIDPLFDFGLTD